MAGIRFTYSLGMAPPEHYLPIARAVDESGWDSISIPDGIFYPKESSSTYPYSADGGREFLENKPFMDPFALVTHLAAVTDHVEFLVAVLKLPVRHPVMVAKLAATAAILSGNRFSLGVGTSPWPEDYEVCGVPWEGRGRRLEEAIEVVRGLTAGGYFEHHGEAYDFPLIKIEPVPTSPIPILLGGQADALLRRAARLGDGWISAGTTEDGLIERIGLLNRFRAEAGRDTLPFRIHARTPDTFTVDGVRHLYDIGVTDVVMRFHDAYTLGPDLEPVQSRLDSIRRFADDVIAKV